MKTVIFDLDGTLADLSHRLQYIFKPNRDYRRFFATVGDDAVIEDVAEVFRFMHTRYNLVVVSGRSDECREATVTWLKQNHLLPDLLLMRKEGDHRPDYIVKKEIYEQFLKDLDILCVFDDRMEVVNMWRRQGLRCMQVAPGFF